MVIEMIAAHAFLTWSFRIGLPVINRELEVSTADFKPKILTTLKEPEGKFWFPDTRNVFFLSRVYFFRFFRIVTPFPLKASGTFNGINSIRLVVRLPIGSCLFFLLWLTLWTIGSVAVGLQSKDIESLFFGAIGWVFTALIIWISYSVEKARLEIMIEELKEIIEESNG